MIVVRPVQESDLDGLMNLAQQAGPGMTNLPANREVLAGKIESAAASFAKADDGQVGEELYFFIMEESESNTLVGTSAIFASVGISRPFYSYKVMRLAHTSRELEHYETVRALQMVNEFRGASEIGMLFLSAPFRKDGNGRLLSRFRYLFMAEFPQRFCDPVMAEMRGVQDDKGNSPFWDSLGRHFFDMDFASADRFSAEGNYQFIADLMPKFPIYTRLLPKAAQDAIGNPHAATKPALNMLFKEGFRYEGYVDVFDAGPSVHCPLHEIRTVKDSVRLRVGKIVGSLSGPSHMICNTQTAEFRAVAGPAEVAEDSSITLSSSTAAQLRVGVGDDVRHIVF